MDTFTNAELNRYHRQLILPEIGKTGQEKLKHARVLMIGAGGLGCPVLQYLGAAGVGTIGIVDFDVVEIHNLQRQILYTSSDVGKLKVLVAKERLQALNPHVEVQLYPDVFKRENGEKMVQGYDVVVDGSDNFPTRYLINDICVKFGKPLVFGSIFGFEGQLAVFNYLGGKNLRDVYPEPPDPEDVPACNENGVLGVVPGLLGTYMANACLQLILGLYRDKGLLVFDFKQIDAIHCIKFPI